MASVYTNDLRLEEIGSGEQSGTWGDTTNTNLELIAEAFAFGTETITTNADAWPTTIADGATDPGRAMFLKYGGALDSACTITLGPNTVSKMWFIHNATTDSGSSGPYSILIAQGDGDTKVTIPNGHVKAVYTNGAGSGAAVTDAFAALSVGKLATTGTVTVGVDDAGHDVTFFGASASHFMLWDESADELVLAQDSKLSFHDAAGGENIVASADGHLEINAGTTLDITAATVQLNTTTTDINGAVALNGAVTGATNITLSGELDAATGDFSGLVDVAGVLTVSNTTASTSSTSGSLIVGGGVGIADDLYVGDDFDVTGDAVIDGTALVTGVLTTTATQVATGGITSGSDIVSDTDSTDDLGTTGVRWANLFVDAITATTDATVGGTLGVTGVLTANAGVVVDNFTIDGTTIALSSGTLVLDSAVNIDLDADNGAITLKDGGVHVASINMGSSDLQLYTEVADKDMKFSGNDGGSPINALILDMEAAGAATFNSSITYGGDLISSTAGTDNVRIGENAGNSIAAAGGTAAGSNNVMIGKDAGTAVTIGVQNTFIGALAGDAVDVGNTNVAVGVSALGAETDGSSNVAIGSSALRLSVHDNSNTAIETFNVAIGRSAGELITTGIRNTAVGSKALYNEQEGVYSVAIGYNALEDQRSDASGQNVYNTAVGANAGEQLSTGIQNTLIGGNAGGDGVITGDNNTAVGFEAGKILTAGAGNTCVGHTSGDTITVGTFNTCVGLGAGAEITDGDNNIAIGYDSHDGGTEGNNNISIGTSSTPSAVDVSNQITLGNSSIASLRCQIQTIAALSDERDKTDIVDLPYGLDFINQTRPVQYKWAIRDEYINATLGTNPHQDKVRNGFIAQELLALGNVEQHQLAFNDNPDRLEASYGSLIPMLVKAIQELSAKNDALAARIAVLEG